MPFGIRRATKEELRKEIADLQKKERIKEQRHKEAVEYKALLQKRNQLKYAHFEAAKRQAGKAFDGLGRVADNLNPPLHDVASEKRRRGKGVDLSKGLFGGAD